MKKDSKSHIFKHLHPTTACFDLYNFLPLKIIDKANSKLDLKFKEALHINWTKPNLNPQKNYVALIYSFTIACITPLFLLFLFFPFLSYLLFWG